MPTSCSLAALARTRQPVAVLGWQRSCCLVLLALAVFELVRFVKDDRMRVQVSQGTCINPQCVVACQDHLQQMWQSRPGMTW